MEPNQTSNNSKKSSLWISFGGLVLIIIGLVLWNYRKTDAPANIQTKNEGNNSLVATKEKLYKDGTFSADGSYVSPAGKDQIGVTLVVKDQKVIDVTVVAKATNQVSLQLQEAFIKGFKGVVVGKLVNDIALTVVNGASLTPKGFMDALGQIKLESRS